MIDVLMKRIARECRSERNSYSCCADGGEKFVERKEIYRDDAGDVVDEDGIQLRR